MGDPAGVGPEIIAMALADRDIFKCCQPVVLGDETVLCEALLRLCDTAPEKIDPEMRVKTIDAPDQAQSWPGTMDVISLSSLTPGSVKPGNPVVAGGAAMVRYIQEAVDMALRNEIQAMVTGPISKSLMHQAGFHYDGHTQLIAERTNTLDYVMMLAGETLRVVLVTIHCPMKDVPDLLNPESIEKTISITSKALKRDFGLERPRLAVAALNPHAGEDGLFGSEERDIIIPAMDRVRKQGVLVEGPFPADTLFQKAAQGAFDAVVCMYHDQGLIPLKLLHFSDGVNVTLGLSIIRTSVDHGTAYDIAGRGMADPSSLKAAIRMAAKMAQNRAEHPKSSA